MVLATEQSTDLFEPEHTQVESCAGYLPHSSISVTAQIWLIFTRYAFQRNGNGFLDLSACIRVFLYRRRRSAVDALGPALLHRRDEVQKEVGHVLSCCDPGG